MLKFEQEKYFLELSRFFFYINENTLYTLHEPGRIHETTMELFPCQWMQSCPILCNDHIALFHLMYVRSHFSILPTIPLCGTKAEPWKVGHEIAVFISWVHCILRHLILLTSSLATKTSVHTILESVLRLSTGGTFGRNQFSIQQSISKLITSSESKDQDNWVVFPKQVYPSGGYGTAKSLYST